LTYYSGEENDEDDDDEEEEDEEYEYEEKEEEEDTKEPLLQEIWTDRGRCYSYNSQIARP
jgi:hypothetical protein